MRAHSVNLIGSAILHTYADLYININRYNNMKSRHCLEGKLAYKPNRPLHHRGPMMAPCLLLQGHALICAIYSISIDDHVPHQTNIQMARPYLLYHRVRWDNCQPKRCYILNFILIFTSCCCAVLL